MEYEERTRIATPEGVELELVLAGLASRFIAELFDALILGAVLVAMVVVAALAGGGAGALILVVVLGGFLLITVAYHVAFEVLAGGRTPGKRWAGLRVVLEGGGPVDLRASLVRNLIRLIEGVALLYVPAVVAVLATRRNQRLGDLAAGTLVIREPGRAALVRRPLLADDRRRRRRLGCLRDYRRRPRRDPYVPRPPRAVHARVAPRPGARAGGSARPEGRRPAPGHAARGAARGHRRREVRTILNTRDRQSTVRSASPMSDLGSTSTPAPGWEQQRPHRPPTPGRGRDRAPGSGGASPRAFLDGLLIGVINVILVLAIDQTVGSLLSFVIGIVYYAGLEGSRTGQTLGKKALGIRVIDANNARADRLRPRRDPLLRPDHLDDPAVPRLLLDALGPREPVLARQVRQRLRGARRRVPDPPERVHGSSPRGMPCGAMSRFQRAPDPDRSGQLLLEDGEPVGLARLGRTTSPTATARAGSSPCWSPTARRATSRRCASTSPPTSTLLVADRALGRADWLARAETLELVTASAALAAAEVALADALG